MEYFGGILQPKIPPKFRQQMAYLDSLPPKIPSGFCKIPQAPCIREMPLCVQNPSSKMHRILESTLPGGGTNEKFPWNNWNTLLRESWGSIMLPALSLASHSDTGITCMEFQHCGLSMNCQLSTGIHNGVHVMHASGGICSILSHFEPFKI